MSKYRLSFQARRQISDIGAFTARRFGLYQARAYHEGLERTFGLLADFPKMGTSADELLRGARRFRFQSHDVFYTEEEDGVLIRAVFHTAQNVRPSLFDNR
ncbi:type II toxin-antitoxin system RelE/ParE family toxin [Methylocystis parvus]|uniref:Toxin n=1 Tax=Methylocystis parvus TaxID=134 RepID=A0A6B8M1G2_9HYPH|nr:type II toxin-antitoxin system RelE/ParE family toxin [Methylocystis parvus]QGM98707.1 type II toxin-antitoxin system RelE/ParE family toxin [Methylocystis parvus]WBK00945.1 type II toxin-antitoxin system RelE/ParE family toxin [Methylocystis parvus OBBP]